MTRRRGSRDECGSALVLALVFVTVIGMVLGFVLAFVETTFKYASTSRTDRAELYAADGAMEGAIARVQAGGPCGDYSTSVVNSVPVDVTCEPAPRPPPPPAEPAPSPAQAILTLGSQGIQQVEGSGPVAVRGDVFSYSAVANRSASELAVQGEVGAVGDCTGTITASAIRCANRGGAADPAAAPDPAFPPDLLDVPPRKVAPECPGDDWLVRLGPGYYDDAEALSRLTADPTCPGKVVWFEPGVYYFNFNFSSTGTTCDQDANLCTWRIDDPGVNVVGGRPLGWDAGLSARPTIDLPGGCLRDQDGVQLVFGGRSRVAHSAGKVELCPRPGRAVPPVTVHGLDQGAAVEQTVTMQAGRAVSDPTGFLIPENARAVDERPARLTADAALTSLAAPAPAPAPTPETASIALSGFGSVPAGSRGVHVRLRVVHRETGDVGDLKARVSVDGGPVAGSPFAVPPCDRADPAAYCEHNIDVGLVAADKLPSLSVTYEAAPGPPPGVVTDPPRTGTASLDGIVVEARYTPPALEALSGCLVQPYDPASANASCALWQTSGPDSSLSIGGTVYVPTAAVDLDLAGVAAPALNRGIISASLRLKASAGAGYLGPVVALPEVHTKRALLALQAPGEGVVQMVGSGRTLIRGDVFSQSVVANQSTAAPLAVQGTVAAVGACTGTIEVKAPPPPPAPLRCQNPYVEPVAPSEGADPVYPAAVEVVPARRTVPATCDGPVVALQPGYYDDAQALSRLTTGGACAGKVVWLKPGAYYFDFNFASTGPSCDVDTSLCTWRLDDPTLNVVGGTTPGWDESESRRPAVDIPGGCRTDQAGVQLIFGGESRLHQAAGNVELCPFLGSRLAPAIPLYGLARGAAHEQARSFPAGEHTSANFTDPTHAYEIDEQPTRLTADAASPALATSASITVGGFAPAVPDGSRFVSATLRIAHREVALSGVQTVTVVDATGGLLASQVVPLCPDFCEQRIPLPTITSPAQLEGIRATYQVALAGAGPVTESLDGIELEVRSTPPSFRALSGCVTATPPCALLKADGAASKLVLSGTVYAPTALLDLDLHGLSSPIVNDGIIAGAARLTIRPLACYEGPAISHLDAQFPSEPPEAGVVFTACIRGTPVLRARVTFSAPQPAVESWSVLR